MAAKPYSLLLLLHIFLSPFTTSCWDIFGGSDNCSPSQLMIYQWPSGFTALHVPKFTVEITNEAWQVDAVYGVQISCPEFASTGLINPVIFRRVTSFTCLLKNGSKINQGEVVSFEYSNLFPYPLAVTAVQC